MIKNYQECAIQSCLNISKDENDGVVEHVESPRDAVTQSLSTQKTSDTRMSLADVHK